jgi:hypothetical protein
MGVVNERDALQRSQWVIYGPPGTSKRRIGETLERQGRQGVASPIKKGPPVLIADR